jgi:hypothetical protein
MHIKAVNSKEPAAMPSPVDPAMTEALRWALKRGLRVNRPTPFQIKIDDVSYYPGKGTIFVDGETRRRRETGLDALERLLIKKRLIRDPREPTMEVITMRVVE